MSDHSIKVIKIFITFVLIVFFIYNIWKGIYLNAAIDIYFIFYMYFKSIRKFIEKKLKKVS